MGYVLYRAFLCNQWPPEAAYNTASRSPIHTDPAHAHKRYSSMSRVPEKRFSDFFRATQNEIVNQCILNRVTVRVRVRVRV